MTTPFARTLRVDPAQTEILRLPDRDANDALDYTIDFSDFFAESDDSLASVQIISQQPTDLTFSQQAINNSGLLLTVIISGGQPVADYQIRVTATTTQGHTFARIFWQLTATLALNNANGAPVTVIAGPPVNPSQVATALNAVIETLPTTLPNQPGVLWNNNGVIQRS